MNKNIQLPPCVERCVEALADHRAQQWREEHVVSSFQRMLESNATLLEAQHAYDDICFEAVTVWVDESVLLLCEAKYEHSLAIRKFGVPPCAVEDHDSYPVFSTGYDIIDEVDEILLDQQALEEDSLGKDCDSCKTMGASCTNCSVTLLEGI
jgi:hypothetical protein